MDQLRLKLRGKHLSIDPEIIGEIRQIFCKCALEAKIDIFYIMRNLSAIGAIHKTKVAIQLCLSSE